MYSHSGEKANGQPGVWEWHIRQLANYCEVAYPADRERVLAAVNQAVAARAPYSLRFRIVTPGGDTRWVLASAESAVDEAGRPWQLIGRIEDITEHARETSEDAEQFAYLAAHDLQEPLRTVTNFAQLLSRETKGQLGTDAAQYLDFIIDGTKRMRALVDGLLAWSRAGVAAVGTYQAVDCAQIVAACVQRSRMVIEENGGCVVVGALPVVSGDAARLTQLFEYLLSNCIRFRRPDIALAIEISTERVAEGWQFCVRDNGTGFDPAQAEAIFAPFRRLHGRGVSGSGIGLAICRRIAASHGGKIRAEGTPDRGAAVYVTLPA